MNLIKFTFTAFDKEFVVHCDNAVDTNIDLLNEKSKALEKANREFLDKFLKEDIDPYPGWWMESSATDFYWNVGNNFD